MGIKANIIISAVALGGLALGAYYNSAQHDVVDLSTSSDVQMTALLDARLMAGDADNTGIIVSDQLGELTLINFWASWCAPCRDEMPVFEAMYRRANTNGFQIIGIAIDSQNKAQPMLDSMDITYPILYAEKTGYALMESTGNPQGLLPYSILLDKDGKILEQVLGKIHEEQIAEWLAKHL